MVTTKAAYEVFYFNPRSMEKSSESSVEAWSSMEEEVTKDVVARLATWIPKRNTDLQFKVPYKFRYDGQDYGLFFTFILNTFREVHAITSISTWKTTSESDAETIDALLKEVKEVYGGRI